MPAHDPSGPPPDPHHLTDFEALTARLRELFAWCGSPKYASISQASGLAPSAISGLIGKRPSRRPSQTATLRFVEACLQRGGLDADATTAAVEEWSATWQRLDAAEGESDVPRPGVAAPSATSPSTSCPPTGRLDGPHRRRSGRPLALGAALVVVLAVVAAVTLDLTRRDSADAGGPRAVCRHADISKANDVRNARTWSTAFRCPNEIGAAVRLQPAPGSPLVSRMKTPTSWFVCWTRGKEHAGGNAIWYYTQGDTAVSGYQGDHSWGYVAASDLGTEKDPDPRAFRRCPSNTPAL